MGMRVREAGVRVWVRVGRACVTWVRMCVVRVRVCVVRVMVCVVMVRVCMVRMTGSVVLHAEVLESTREMWEDRGS